MSRKVYVAGVGMIPFAKPGANAPYPEMGAVATRAALTDAAVAYSDIEQAFVIDWGKDPWAMACEPVAFGPRQLTRIWPKVIEPEGRIQFVGAYADNLNWGMEAATRSANRVARSTIIILP